MAAILYYRGFVRRFRRERVFSPISFRASRVANYSRRLSSPLDCNRRSSGGALWGDLDNLLRAIPSVLSSVALLRAGNVTYLLVDRQLFENAITGSNCRVRNCRCPSLPHSSNRNRSDSRPWRLNVGPLRFFISASMVLA